MLREFGSGFLYIVIKDMMQALHPYLCIAFH
jgi:hypothetical protein